ncbi:hypothetical protein BBO99_00001006 [Phytophthora kernoviae]|uniref:Calponin-homology (CH) domain-containing protein n=3 Tax=Phytophthora kernoviae TaxID=325452 RepID=A0A3R7JYP5_9STRA|nr:hypothetical protein G195_003601 [Phytophthora kernoviae 00238/432]KAG2531762.1 hypothetical protein JM18_000968 [Phytophthora kernoviae]RLN46478.1 hypothetical protein BBI17_000907 [Phytophthora kernoviae]RLN84880.1 hypothetical protein BBO99_00001006 [Phytophthora kernoviae]
MALWHTGNDHVQSFHEILATDVQVTSMADLCDGVFLSKIMHHIDSDYVNLEQINEQPGGNWALKSNNLKTLLRAVELFYTDELGQICHVDELVDPLLIAKESDVHEVAKLSELLLGCAVQCPNKSEYIHSIMQMGSSEQASLMHAIENLMRRFQPTSPSGASTTSRHNSMSHGASFDEVSASTPSMPSAATLATGSSAEALAAQLAQAFERGSSMELRYLDLDNEKRELTERFERALAEHRELTDRYAALEIERDQLRSERQHTLTRDNKKIQQIVENEIHALQMQLEEKDLELNRVRRESGERLMVLENEVRRQADELDISRSKLGTLNKLEASVAKYKKKLEDMSSLRNQVRELEAYNAQYLDKMVDMESTIKTMPALKEIVEKYKNQVVELETANIEASSSLGVKDQKIRRLQEELDSALGGKEFLESQVEELRTQVASMQYHEANDDGMAAVTELTKRLKEKESVINELSEQRAKLENYTKKTLHAVQTKYMVAVSSHRNQINEKQERVDFLEKKMKEIRASYSREQALMMSSFYEIGTEMQRRTMMPQGPAPGAPGAGSWLANKRTEERAKRRQGA